jgi:hypothetical protein
LIQDECPELNRLIDEYGERVGHLSRILAALPGMSGEASQKGRQVAEEARVFAERAWSALERHVIEQHPDRDWSQIPVQPLPGDSYT